MRVAFIRHETVNGRIQSADRKKIYSKFIIFPRIF